MALTEAAVVEATATPPSRASTPVRRRWEIWILVLSSATLYVVAGVWLRYTMHYTIGDSLTRTADAVYVLFSRDPHLAAIGSVWLPFSEFIQIPFALLLRPFGQVELAGPVSTALCTVLTTLIIAQLCRVLEVSRVATFAICLVWAFNPVAVFYAANGMSEASSFMCLALAMFGYLAWIRLKRTSYLVVLAMGLAGAVLIRYEALGVVPVMAFLAAWDTKTRRPSLITMLIAAMPAAAAFLLWMVSDWLLLGDAFRWAKNTGPPPVDPPWLMGAHDFPTYLLYVGRWTIIFGPLLVVLVLLLSRPSRFRGTLGILAAAGVFPVVHLLLLTRHTSWGDPRYFAAAAMFAAVGAAWLASSGPRPNWRWIRAGWDTAVVAVLLVGSVTAPIALTNPVATRVEAEGRIFGSFFGIPQPVYQTFHGFPDPQSTQDFRLWRQVAADLDPELARGKRVIVDTNIGFGAVLFSKHPSGFVMNSDRDFESILSDPAGSVDYAISSYPCNPHGLDEVSLRFGYPPNPSKPGPGLVHDYGCARVYRLQPVKS
jgi:hypothetical protein